MVLIAGGRDKGASSRSILPLADKIRGLVLFGEAKEKIEGELGPYLATYGEEDLEGAG